MLRLEGNYTSLNGILYQVEIHDNGYTGAAEDICFGPDGVVYTQSGKSKDRNSRIVSRTADVNITVENATHEAFLTEVGLATENQFWIKIKKAGQLDYIGKVLPDLIKIEDRPYPYFTSIEATDGLSALKDVSYYTAQTADVFRQVGDGKFRAVSSADRKEYNIVLGFWDDLFDSEFQDIGDYFTPATSVYTGTEIVCDFTASVRVLANPDGKRNMALIIEKNGETIKEHKVTWDKNKVQEKTMQVTVKDIGLNETDVIRCRLWREAFHWVKIYKGASFENSVTDVRRTFKNVYDTFLNHIGNALSQLNTAFLYDAGDIFFESMMDWRPSDDAGGQMLEKLGCAYNAFVTNFKESPVSVTSAYDVLVAISTLLNGRIRYADGRYRFEQLDSFKPTAQAVRITDRYDREMGYLGSAGYSYKVSKGDCAPGGYYLFLPALGSAEVIYDRVINPDFLLGTEAYSPGDEFEAEYTGSDNELRFKIRIRNKKTLTNRDYHNIYRVKLKIGDKYAKVENLNGEHDGDEIVYSSPEWSDEESYIYVWGQHRSFGSQSDKIHYIIEANFTLPPILEDGILTYSVIYDSTLKDRPVPLADHRVTLEPDRIDYNLESDALYHIKSGSEALKDQTVRTIISNENNTKAEIAQVYMSSNTVFDEDPGRMVRLVDGNWVDIPFWILKSQGIISELTSIDLLLAYSLMTAQVNPSKMYNGRLYTLGIWDRVVPIDGTEMLLNTGTFYTRTDEVDGEWIGLQDGSIDNLSDLVTLDSRVTSNRTDSLPTSTGSTTVVNSTTGGGSQSVEVHENWGRVTGDGVDVTVAPLPDPEDSEADEINGRILLIRDKWVLEYPEDYQIDKANERILCDLVGERLRLRMKI